MGGIRLLGEHDFKKWKTFKIIGLSANPHPTHKIHGYLVTIFCNSMSDDFDIFNLECSNYNLLNIFYFVSNDFNLFMMPHFDYFDVNWSVN